MSQQLAAVGEAIDAGKRDDISVGCVFDTVLSHDQAFGNYEWLTPFYGKLLWVEFEEPAGSGRWRHYDRYYWARHGCVISHHPEDLVQEHVRFFVDPRTKQINLRFWFERPSGEVYQTATDRHFYELERDYFARNSLCGAQGDVPTPPHRDTYVCAPPGRGRTAQAAEGREPPGCLQS